MTPRNALGSATLVLLCGLASCERRQTLVEFSSDIPPPTFIGGGTCSYGPTNIEKEFYDRLGEAGQITTQDKPGEYSDTSNAFRLQGHQNQFVSWWGIVRDIKRDEHGQGGRLLIENKYFNGSTDFNFQMISINGGGDFDTDLTDITGDLVPLILVRVYGTVRNDSKARPLIKANYVRAWHWGQFRFMDFGEDRGNPEWKKNAKLTANENPYAINDGGTYYRDHLAPTAEQLEIVRPFYHERTRIQFANIPLETWGETGLYKPTEVEKPFLDKVGRDAQSTVQSKPGEPFQSGFQLRGHVGQFVSWFGIVREVIHEVSRCGGSLLIENKYFQMGEDKPPQTVSINGGGNFRAQLTSFTEDLPLSLVRVYGRVVREDNGVPIVQAEYIRVWRWGEFDFDDYGADNGDPDWKKYIQLTSNEPVHQTKLSAEYYIQRLGPREDQAQTIREFFQQIDAMCNLDLSPTEEFSVNQ
jgi:hypothetical protein